MRSIKKSVIVLLFSLIVIAPIIFECEKMLADDDIGAGDCCVGCTNYCACDAKCYGKCVALLLCAQGVPSCPGDGTKCCLCKTEGTY